MSLRSIIVAAAMIASTGAAFANCYNGLGCDNERYFTKTEMRQLDCDSLWQVRNGIYAQNGYCFKTQRAISFFGNGQCHVNDQGRVSLNAYERTNVATIVEAEQHNGCN